MEDFLKPIKECMKSLIRKLYLRLEDNVQISNETNNIVEYDDIKTRLCELEEDVKRLKDLPQSIVNLQAKVDKLPMPINSPKPEKSKVLTSLPISQNDDVSQQSSESIDSAPETYYVQRMGTTGNIEIRNKIAKSEAIFELITLGNKAKLHPLSEQSAYLIMQKKYLLEPAFVVSGTGQRIHTDKAAQYELRGNVWEVVSKGKVEMT